MRKISFFLLIAVMTFSLFSCSSDDESAPVAVPAAEYDSQIKVNGNLFLPTKNSATEQNISVESISGDVNQKSFRLLKRTDTDLEVILVSITYPNTQTSINGTYSFDSEEGSNGLVQVQGLYQGSGQNYLFDSGNVKITEFADNIYKLEFNAVAIVPNDPSDFNNITGYFRGTFVNLDPQ